MVEQDRKVPPLELEERVMDMPNISPGRRNTEKDPSPRQFPIYKPHHPQRRHFPDESSRKPQIPEPSKADDGDKSYAIPDHMQERDIHAGNAPVHSKDRKVPAVSKDDSFIKEAKEKYQWYNERHLSPPVAVRRSRSLSPPLDLDELHREIELKRAELQVDLVELECIR